MYLCPCLAVGLYNHSLVRVPGTIGLKYLPVTALSENREAYCSIVKHTNKMLVPVSCILILVMML